MKPKMRSEHTNKFELSGVGVLLLIIVLVSGSCRVSELIEFKKDFSGRYMIVLENSKAMRALDSLAENETEESRFFSFKEINNDTVMKKEMNDLIVKVRESLSKVQGITDISVETNGDNIHFVSFSFATLEGLNACLSPGCLGKKGLNVSDALLLFDPFASEHAFTLKNNYLYTNRAIINSEVNGTPEVKTVEKLNSCTFISLIKFDKKISKVDFQGNFDFNKENNAVLFEETFTDIASGSDSLSFRIKF